MKVTAILPDQLIHEVQDFSNGKNITESLKIALEEWLSLQRIKQLNKLIKSKPFEDHDDSPSIRAINRKVK